MENPGQPKQYDFIFAGAGMAAASLLLRMLKQEELAGKSILMVDPAPFAADDKTWCFWEKGAGFFESLVEKSWDKAWFHGESWSHELQLLPYRYKMIRSKKLFEHTLNEIARFDNVKLVSETVASIEKSGNTMLVQSESGKRFSGTVVFNSIPPAVVKKSSHFYFLQHFTGWFVETAEDVFDPESPVLMDFSIAQQNDCRFMYLLPFSPREALVEYTLFSEQLLQEKEYEAALQDYMMKKAPRGFRITQKEKGIIPMYSESFPNSIIPGLVHIGTAGNQTKASTGYTFSMVQKHSDALVEALLRNEIPDASVSAKAGRFAWFDRVLLRVLSERKVSGREIFQALFQKNPVQRVFRFLDEESNPAEEFQIMNSVPVSKFMLPGLKELFR